MEVNTFKMFHGGKKWELIPREVYPSKKGRYEHGPGIYLTNSYITAQKYSGGGRVVQRSIYRLELQGYF